MLVTVFALAGAARCHAQRDTTFAVLGAIGGGFVANISQPALLPKSGETRGPIGTLRFLWKPDHRLRVGLEMGWLRLTRAEGVVHDSGDVQDRRQFELDALPMLVTFVMGFDHFNVSVGAGYYLMLSYLIDGGLAVNSSQLDYGIAFSGEYLAPLSESFSLGGGVGVYGITQLGQYVAAVQARAQYRLAQW